jgi:hypothetical protein
MDLPVDIVDFEMILAELKAARSDVIGRSAEAEHFDSQTPDRSA